MFIQSFSRKILTTTAISFFMFTSVSSQNLSAMEQKEEGEFSPMKSSLRKAGGALTEDTPILCVKEEMNAHKKVYYKLKNNEQLNEEDMKFYDTQQTPLQNLERLEGLIEKYERVIRIKIKELEREIKEIEETERQMKEASAIDCATEKIIQAQNFLHDTNVKNKIAQQKATKLFTNAKNQLEKIENPSLVSKLMLAKLYAIDFLHWKNLDKARDLLREVEKQQNDNPYTAVHPLDWTGFRTF